MENLNIFNNEIQKQEDFQFRKSFFLGEFLVKKKTLEKSLDLISLS